MQKSVSVFEEEKRQKEEQLAKQRNKKRSPKRDEITENVFHKMMDSLKKDSTINLTFVNDKLQLCLLILFSTRCRVSEL